MKWYPVENDLIGGWAVSSLDKPLSQHDMRPEADGDPSRSGYVIADLMERKDAIFVALLLTSIGYVPRVLKGDG